MSEKDSPIDLLTMRCLVVCCFASLRNEEAGETPARSRRCVRPVIRIEVESQTLFAIGSILTGRAIPGGRDDKHDIRTGTPGHHDTAA